MSNQLTANKHLVRRFVEEYMNNGDETVAHELLSESVQWRIGDFTMDSAAAVMQANASYANAFPDWRGVIDDQIAEDDKVVTRISFAGTHQGEFNAIPATGRAVKVTAIFIVRIEDGKIVEAWRNGDDLGMMRQLGALPMG